MLTRVGPDTFSAPTNSTSTIVARSDDGAPSATFSYGTALPPQTIQGLPGCTFTVTPGLKMFRCVVIFGQGAAPRYDLFEVDANGLLVDLVMPLTPATTGTMRQARIRGVALPAIAMAPSARTAKGTKKAKKAKGAKKAKKTQRPKKGTTAKKPKRAKRAKRPKKVSGRKTRSGTPRRRGGARG
jgi:hypothetical protein